MENWPQLLIFGGIILIGIASFAFSAPQASAQGAAMSDTEVFQVLLGAIGLAIIIGGMYKK